MIVAHRANMDGPSRSENEKAAVDACLVAGFGCEVDVRVVDGAIFLGHDSPQEKVDLAWLRERGSSLLIHCKNLEAARMLSREPSLNVFGHSSDEFVVTSRGDIFCAPGVVHSGCVCVMPELVGLGREDIPSDCVVLTDYPHRYTI